jgi:hypothetical protein
MEAETLDIGEGKYSSVFASAGDLVGYAEQASALPTGSRASSPEACC